MEYPYLRISVNSELPIIIPRLIVFFVSVTSSSSHLSCYRSFFGYFERFIITVGFFYPSSKTFNMRASQHYLIENQSKKHLINYSHGCIKFIHFLFHLYVSLSTHFNEVSLHVDGKPRPDYFLAKFRTKSSCSVKYVVNYSSLCLET